jgi:ribose-phosphate pyrophosphokinase
MSNELLDPGDVRFFSGSSHPQLAAEIAKYVGVPLEETSMRRFSNDNMYIQLLASVRSRRVYIVQSLCQSVNDHLVELLMMIDIARSSAAKEIIAILPYFSFARSDKKDSPRISITARLVADLIKTAGATQVMTMVLHSPQVHGFFSVPTDHLTSRPVILDYFRQRDLSDTIVVAPDLGGAKSAARFAKDLGLPMTAGNKERVSDTKVIISSLVGGQMQGKKKALIYDDEIATGGTILEMSEVLVREGIEEIWVACTHGVFVRNALQRICAVPQITELVTTDTVPQNINDPKLHVLCTAEVFGEAILRNYHHQSIGGYFAYGEGCP